MRGLIHLGSYEHLANPAQDHAGGCWSTRLWLRNLVQPYVGSLWPSSYGQHAHRPCGASHPYQTSIPGILSVAVRNGFFALRIPVSTANLDHMPNCLYLAPCGPALPSFSSSAFATYRAVDALALTSLIAGRRAFAALVVLRSEWSKVQMQWQAADLRWSCV